MSKKSKKVARPSAENPQKAANWKAFYEELQKETPRGAVLLGAAFLDEHLRQLIEVFLIDSKSVVGKFLEGENAPLGTFSARIQATYCMGLISEEEFRDLNIIRGIRNQFAHSLHGLSLADSWIINQCEQLTYPRKLDFSTKLSPGDSLLITIALIASWIRLRALGIESKQERREIMPNVKVVEHIKVGFPTDDKGQSNN